MSVNVPAGAFDILRLRLDLERELQFDLERNLQGDKRLHQHLAESFLNFLPYWHFTDRERGDVLTFGRCPLHGDEHGGDLWSGQERFAQRAIEHPWLYALKAGKLGFTELECAYDAWVARFGQPNSRVHLFSRGADSSKELLRIVRFGLDRLPPSFRPAYLEEEAGGKTSTSLRFRLSEDDERTVVAYAAGPNVSIDASCQHAHVDELARMPFARETWHAIYSTVSPSGTCHVVTRGRGEDNYAADLWRSSEQGETPLATFFAAWDERPGRGEEWLRETEAGMVRQQFQHYAPSKPEDALAGDEDVEYIPIELWDRCKEDLPALMPGSKELSVLGVDAGIKNDYSGVVIVTRHPDRRDDVAIRGVRAWEPGPRGGEVNLAEVESFIKAICLGGCAMGHHLDEREMFPGCEACHPLNGASPILVPPYAVYEVAYDPYQMENSAQRLRRLGINMQPFPQQKDRLIADSELRDLIVNKRIAHDGGQTLRTHVENAAAVIDSREDRKIRIVKKAPHRKVDLLVAASMACFRCLRLYL